MVRISSLNALSSVNKASVRPFWFTAAILFGLQLISCETFRSSTYGSSSLHVFMLIAPLLWMPSISSYMQYVYAAIWNLVWVLQPAAVQCCMSAYVLALVIIHQIVTLIMIWQKPTSQKGFPAF
jgi:hypothetical protein